MTVQSAVSAGKDQQGVIQPRRIIVLTASPPAGLNEDRVFQSISSIVDALSPVVNALSTVATPTWACFVILRVGYNRRQAYRHEHLRDFLRYFLELSRAFMQLESVALERGC